MPVHGRSFFFSYFFFRLPPIFRLLWLICGSFVMVQKCGSYITDHNIICSPHQPRRPRHTHASHVDTFFSRYPRGSFVTLTGCNSNIGRRNPNRQEFQEGRVLAHGIIPRILRCSGCVRVTRSCRTLRSKPPVVGAVANSKTSKIRANQEWQPLQRAWRKEKLHP